MGIFQLKYLNYLGVKRKYNWIKSQTNKGKRYPQLPREIR
jgi:hypothetical protein